jgi:predicted TPR repeat methyltransferase
MVDLAAQSGVYDQLYQADLLAWLETAQPAYDAVFAADVFIYVGALEEVFSAVSMLLQAGGLFAFSVEASATDEAGFQLMPSLRYAH